MTDKLFRMAQKLPNRASQRTDSFQRADLVCSIVWAPQSFAVPGRAGWLLCWIPKSHAGSDRVFIIDETAIHISPEVEPLLRDQVFDWDDNKGVVLRAI